jgi:hypothetical protein
MRGTNRGQGFTLEGVFAGLLLVTALLFALQVVSPASYSGDTPGESERLRRQAQDVLAAAEDNGTLTRIVLCGGDNATDTRKGAVPSPYNAIANGVINDNLAPDLQHNATEFGYMLNRTFSERGYRYSVNFTWIENGERVSQAVYPTNTVEAPRDAVVATRTVTLYDSMETTGINGSSTSAGRPNKYCDAAINGDGVPLSSVTPPDGFYADDIDEGELYNIVEVRVMVW